MSHHRCTRLVRTQAWLLGTALSMLLVVLGVGCGKQSPAMPHPPPVPMVTKILSTGCIDRNSNGQCDTSVDTNGDGVI